MMRPIKFRYIVKHIASGNIEVKHYSLDQIEERSLKELSPAFLADYELVSRDEFVGLHDKNETPIYEGDVLIDSSGRKTDVFYEDAGFMVRHDCDWLINFTFVLDSNVVCVEVIGNIHENPELLKGEEA